MRTPTPSADELDDEEQMENAHAEGQSCMQEFWDDVARDLAEEHGAYALHYVSGMIANLLAKEARYGAGARRAQGGQS